MKQFRTFWVMLGAIGALFFVAACGLLVPKIPTALPTEVLPSRTPATDTPVAMVTSTPVVPATSTATSTANPSLTPTAVVIASPTSSVAPTSLPATATFTPLPTRVPPTRTPTPTRTRVPPTPTATVTPTPVPPVTITDWQGEYYANLSLRTPAQVVRNDRSLDFYLAAGMAPATDMPSENWSARWTRIWRFKEGNYRFHLLVDDGARLWVGGRLLFDAWTDGAAREFTAERYLKGNAPIRLEYYNGAGEARVRLTWEKITQYANWMGSYYDVPDLSGLPVFQRDDRVIRFNWGTGAARADMPADSFSVRWTRRLTFGQAGQVRFHTDSDDGVRLWVDNMLVIDAWRNGHAMNDGVVNLTAGAHDLRVDYYEYRGPALVELSWEYVLTTPTPTSTPTSRPTNTAVLPTDTAVPPTDTAVPPTDTAVPPTDTAVPPTKTALPVLPAITLYPEAGPIQAPIEVKGSGWPGGAVVKLFLIRSISKQGGGTGDPVAEVTAGADGRFETQLTIPKDRAWEGLRAATILAQAGNGRYKAQATYRLLPELHRIEFRRIPTAEDRFALQEPIYLVLESGAQWVYWFGSKPSPADPPVDWEREILLGAFLGKQPANVAVDVDLIVQRDSMVSVWLTAIVPQERASRGGGTSLPRVMVRVSRDALRLPDYVSKAGLVFSFLDANGRLLAQIPQGVGEPLSLTPSPEAGALQAPSAAGGTPTLEAAPAVGAASVEAGAVPTATVAVPEAASRMGATLPQAGTVPTSAAAMPQVMAAPQESPVPTLVASAAEEKAAKPPGPVPGNWVWIGTGGFLLLGWGVALGVARRLNRRR